MKVSFVSSLYTEAISYCFTTANFENQLILLNEILKKDEIVLIASLLDVL